MKCPFCLLNVKDHVFKSSPDFMAVYNISPMLPGHSLIIPREHVESLHDLTPAKFTEFFHFAREVTKGLCDFFETDAFDWSLQEAEEAGQSVAHLHLHIIPRSKDDIPDTGEWYPLLMENKKQTVIDSTHRPRFQEEEFQAVTQKLRMKFQTLNKE